MYSTNQNQEILEAIIFCNTNNDCITDLAVLQDTYTNPAYK